MRDTPILEGRRRGRLAGLLGLCALFVAACGGGGGGSTMTLVGLSVSQDATWPLNRPIDFTFSEAVDFATVDSSTIAIRQPDDGTPAVGTFRLVAPNVVRFQPRCPLLANLSDSGLEPSPSTSETIHCSVTVAGGSGGPTVRGLSGATLEQGQPVEFRTPLADAPLDQLFVDTAVGGPQPLVRGVNAAADAIVASRIQLGLDPGEVVYFARNTSGDVELEGGFLVPLNLYSDTSTQVAVIVELNQAVNPSATNISQARVRLQFEVTPGSGDWQDVSVDLALIANCSTSGSTLRLVPRGILPQDRRLRVVLQPEFQDIVGSSNPNVDDSLPMQTRLVDFSAIDPLEPNQGADEVYEDFLFGADVPTSLEDGEAAFSEARAEWGDDRLIAGFPFDGTGGPGGNFDLHIQVGSPTVFDTTSTTFFGGPDGVITATQTAVNGRLDLRNLVVPEGATFLIQGPNPAVILATGSIQCDGRILAIGSGNRGVVTLLTTNIPEPGAAGQAGGGRGGAGSPLTTQNSPSGQRGFGAFDVPGGGGQGGESGYSAGPGDGINQRRPGGGGGGTFGPDVIDPQPPASCSASVPRPDNNIIGLDAEQGFPGGSMGFGALHPGQRAVGGLPGPRPFFDLDPDNDFYGRMITADGSVLAGELLRPWAGAGGGGGGDAVKGGAFPGTEFNPGSAEKGAGGGGGGGSLRILCLGDVVVGPRGSIDVGGGCGGGGENTNGVNRVGGGSGGGSGGHLMIEVAGRVDLSAVLGTFPFAAVTNPDVGLLAAGGQGGAGAANAGGSGQDPGNPTPVCKDSVASNSCPIPGGQGSVECAGGDGGPGVIQLHVGSLADIVPPLLGNLFSKGQRPMNCTGSNFNIIKNDGVIKPPPLGSPANVKTANTTTGWARLVPSFGQLSRAQSVWIPLGEAGTRPGMDPAEALEFFFGGTDTLDGLVQRTGSSVSELPPILGTGLGSGSVLTISNQARTAVVSANGLTDDVYQRNPAMLRSFLLRIFPSGGGPERVFDVASATYDPDTERFSLTVDETGQPLLGLLNSDFELRPRFFRVRTSGIIDQLPSSATVKIEFQATEETLTGAPDETAGVPSPWTPDITTLNANADWKFVRFRVLFDIQADGITPLDASTPKPALEFLRMPFRF
jgi:hypothetical protein